VLDAAPGATYALYNMYEQSDDHEPGHVSVSEARQDLAELVNRAAYGGERIRVSRRGRTIAAIVPIGDLELIEQMEDEFDLDAAREALADPENATPIPWKQVKVNLGL
jgi:prevent-host-death family protein